MCLLPFEGCAVGIRNFGLEKSFNLVLIKSYAVGFNSWTILNLRKVGLNGGW